MSEYWDRVRIGEFLRRGLNIRGIIHVGANDGYEIQWYKLLGIDNIIAFEPLPSVFELLKNKYPEILAFNLALGNYEGTYFLNVTPGDGQGSSLLDITDDYFREHPEYEIIDRIPVEVKKFSSVLEDNPHINMNNYNCIVCDTQGNELDVLIGFEDYLKFFDFLNIEVSKVPVYKGASAQEVIDYLDKIMDFRPLTSMPVHNDMLFIKRGVGDDIQEFKIE